MRMVAHVYYKRAGTYCMIASVVCRHGQASTLARATREASYNVTHPTTELNHANDISH